MSKVKTFNPKTPKVTRDNQNRKTPLTRDYTRLGDFKIQEIAPEEQCKKLRQSIEKNGKQIKKLIERKFREPSNSAMLEAKISRIEALINWKMFQTKLIMRKVKAQDKKYETQQENLKAEMQAHIKNLDKIRPKFNPKSAITPTHEGNIEQVFGKQKPEIKRVGNDVKPVRKKRFART